MVSLVVVSVFFSVTTCFVVDSFVFFEEAVVVSVLASVVFLELLEETVVVSVEFSTLAVVVDFALLPEDDELPPPRCRWMSLR